MESRMNQKLSLFALAALSCLSALAIAATPTITSVLGTVQTGQTLTIAGTSMVQEDQTNWDAFFKTTHPNASGFEGPSITADGYEIRPGATYNTYDSTVKLMGSKSLKGHSTGASTSNLDYGTTFYQWNVNMGGTGQVYVRTYVRWNTAIWPNQDIKFWWMGGSSSYLFFNLEPQANGSAPTRW